MSGHSKWSTIKRQKETQDQKRGQVFTKIGRAVTVAVKEGGSADPSTNFSLRLAIEKAKVANMPKENIQRAIDRALGKGEKASDWQEVTYEGFGPENIAIIVKAVTDNSNRTYADLKKIFERNGGKLGSPGSVNYLFEPVGLVELEKGPTPEETILKIMDLEVKDVEEMQEGIDVYVDPSKLANFKEKLGSLGLNVQEASLSLRPKMKVTVDPQKKEKILSFLDQLEDSDDVQDVFVNCVF